MFRNQATSSLVPHAASLAGVGHVLFNKVGTMPNSHLWHGARREGFFCFFCVLFCFSFFVFFCLFF